MITAPSQIAKYLKNLSKWGCLALGLLGLGGYIPFLLSFILAEFLGYTIFFAIIAIFIFVVSANFFNYKVIIYYQASLREAVFIMLFQNIGIITIALLLFIFLIGNLTNPDKPF
jgi:hypothetical protein